MQYTLIISYQQITVLFTTEKCHTPSLLLSSLFGRQKWQINTAFLQVYQAVG